MSKPVDVVAIRVVGIYGLIAAANSRATAHALAQGDKRSKHAKARKLRAIEKRRKRNG